MTLRIPRSLMLALLVPACLTPLPVAAAGSAAALDGKAIFMEKKCNKCHSVSSAAIEKTSKLKGPDLTGALAKHDAKLLKAYLHKQDAINAKKHTQAFTGSDEELDAVVTWLMAQHAPDKKK